MTPFSTAEIRSYSDVESTTYDDVRGHQPRTALELAVWTATFL